MLLEEESMSNIRLRLTRGWPFPGKDRLASLLFNQKRERKRPTFEGILPLPWGFLLCNTKSSLEWQLFTMLEYEPVVTRVVQSLLKPGSCFVDVGANAGFYTVLAAHLVGRTGLVIALEPNPDIFLRLEANCTLNRLENVRLLQCALDESSCRRNLTTFPSYFNQGLSTLLEMTKLPSKQIEVQAVTGDRLLTELDVQLVNLIKIDVEGWEVPVLKGLHRTLQEQRPAVVFEHRNTLWQQAGYSIREIVDLFNKVGHRLFEISYRGLVPIPESTTSYKSCEIVALPVGCFEKGRT